MRDTACLHFPVFVRLELFDGSSLMSFADTPPIGVKR
jgi:hypothetical protein